MFILTSKIPGFHGREDSSRGLLSYDTV